MHRKILRYNQSHVAELLGLKSPVMLSTWEQGDAMPTAINLIKLSLIYRTYPNELYSELFQELREELQLKEGEASKSE